MIQPGKQIFSNIRGRWSEFFDNTHPITLELGCGRGEYTVGLATIFKDRNFIGVDIKGDRIWKGSALADGLGLKNAAFLRTQVQLIGDFFEENEVSEIWITFPDPRPKERDEKRRLTNPRFLELYKRILISGGLVHLKTDNTPLFDYSLNTISERSDVSSLEYTHDLYRSAMLEDHHGIRTKYEIKHHDLGESIKYLRFSLL